MAYIKRTIDSAEWEEQRRFLVFMETYDLKCRQVAALLNQPIDSIYKYRKGLRRMSDQKFIELRDSLKIYLFKQIKKLEEL